MRSDSIKTGIYKNPHRGLLMAAGVCKQNMKAPFIGIASSFSDLVPWTYWYERFRTPD